MTPTGSVEAWFTPERFACVLALFIVAAFPDVVFGAGTFFLRDFGIFTYPLAYYQRESFWRGELPLWNPLSSAGVPFLAQWGTLVLYPPALFYLLLPLSWSLGVFCLLHLFLAGLGMYHLAHRWTGSRFAAAVAGVAFVFNGAMFCCLAWTSTLVGLAWMPWVVGAAERAWREGGRRVIVTAFIGALQMLSGAPEVILLTWLLIGVIWTGDLQISNFRFGIEWRRLARLAGAVLLVSGLAAAQLLPFLDLLAHSQRGAGFGDSAWSMPIWGWANFLVPLFHCFPSHQGVFSQFGQYWLASYYLGIGVAALALLAIGKVRQRRVALLAVLLLLTLILALGDRGRVYGWLREAMPQIGFMRYPIKFVLLAMFIAPLLSAFAVHWYRSLPAEVLRKERRHVGWLALFLALLILAVLVIARRDPLPTDHWPATWQCGLGRAAFLVLILGVFVALPRVQARSQWLWGLALLALLWLDVVTHAPRLNPTVARRVYERGWARAQLQLSPEPRRGGSRVMTSPDARAKLFRLNLTNAVDDYLFSRLGFLGNCNLLDDIPKVESFYPLYPRGVEPLRALLYASTNTDLPRLADFLGVSQITAPGKMIDWQARAGFLPPVTAGQKPVFADDTESLRSLAAPAFDPRGEVFLPVDARPLITVTNRTTATIRAARFTNSRVTLTVDAVAPSLVVIAQTYYHWWRASVDDRPVRLWRANYAFQALEVPAGTHRVELVYRDRSFYLGAAISGLTLLGGALCWRWSRRGDRTSVSAR